MQAAWRLTRSGLSARPSRTTLLAAAVALSAALVTAVACALASTNRAVAAQLDARLGTAEVRLVPAGRGQTLSESALETARAWPGVTEARPLARTTLSLSFETQTLQPQGDEGNHYPRRKVIGANAVLNGLGHNPEAGADTFDRVKLIAGRLPEAPGEILIDAMLAQRLSAAFESLDAFDPAAIIGRPALDYLDTPTPELPATADKATAERLNARVGPRPGDTLYAVRFLRQPIPLTVVGITDPPPLGGRPQAHATLETAALAAGNAGERPALALIEIELDETTDPDAFVETHAGELTPAAILQTTERITSGVEKNLASNRIAFVLGSSLAFLSASFIIMTGLATGMAEQQRALAVLRCLGATRAQLALSQLLSGVTIGLLGALAGVPLGLGLSWLLVTIFSDRISTGLAVPPALLVLSILGAIAAGLAGALWPAWRAARLAPLQGLAARANPPTRRALALTTAAALAGLAAMVASITLPASDEGVFWAYAAGGLPLMFVGYFLLAIPACLLVATIIDRPLAALLRIPPNLVRRSVAATPYRFGFTAGAMMAGLALMISIWTNGTSFMNDWVGRIQFPDAFVSGLALTEDDRDRVEALPFVNATASVTIHPVRTDAFGVKGVSSYRTSFVAFEPGPFFEMTNLEFIQGDPDYALRRLTEGGAVIVAREFLVAQGLGVGDTFTCSGTDDTTHDFEIVGVVTSPGLELVSKFFNIGEEFVDQAMHAVFGSRDDLKSIFGVDAIQLIQIDLADDADDAEAVATIRKELFGSSVIDAGSGRRIKAQLVEIIGSTLVVFSSVAVGAMLIACCGVANLVVAGIHARRFEFGVLRAVGGSRSQLTRVILAEALVIGLTAAIIGTAMGLQGAWAGRVLIAGIAGIEINASAPLTPLAWGWSFVITLPVLAAWPAIARLNKQRPKDLLRSVA